MQKPFQGLNDDMSALQASSEALAQALLHMVEKSTTVLVQECTHSLYAGGGRW